MLQRGYDFFGDNRFAAPKYGFLLLNIILFTKRAIRVQFFSSLWEKHRGL